MVELKKTSETPKRVSPSNTKCTAEDCHYSRAKIEPFKALAVKQVRRQRLQHSDCIRYPARRYRSAALGPHLPRKDHAPSRPSRRRERWRRNRHHPHRRRRRCRRRRLTCTVAHHAGCMLFMNAVYQCPTCRLQQMSVREAISAVSHITIHES